MAQINKKLDKIMSLINVTLKEPITSAKNILDDAIDALERSNIERGLEKMDKVYENANKAFSIASLLDKSDQTKAHLLVLSTQYLMVAEIYKMSIAKHLGSTVVLPFD